MNVSNGYVMGYLCGYLGNKINPTVFGYHRGYTVSKEAAECTETIIGAEKTPEQIEAGLKATSKKKVQSAVPGSETAGTVAEHAAAVK